MKTPDINNKEVRMRLVGRWLDTETTVDEERMLAEYYGSHRPDADEKEAAMLICAMQSMDTGALSDDEDLEKEYDRLMEKHSATGRGRRIMMRIAGVAAAAAVVLAMVLKGLEYGGGENEITALTGEEITAEIKEAKPLYADTRRQPSHSTAEQPRTAVKPKTAEKREAGRRRKQQEKQASTTDMIEQMEVIESLGLAQNETFNIIPAGNAAVIRANTVDKTAMTFLTVSSEEDGSLLIFTMENINL